MLSVVPKAILAQALLVVPPWCSAWCSVAVQVRPYAAQRAACVAIESPSRSDSCWSVWCLPGLPAPTDWCEVVSLRLPLRVDVIMLRVRFLSRPTTSDLLVLSVAPAWWYSPDLVVAWFLHDRLA